MPAPDDDATDVASAHASPAASAPSLSTASVPSSFATATATPSAEAAGSASASAFATSARSRLDLVKPLEELFVPLLHGIASRRKLPSVREPERLAENVAALSLVYNGRAKAKGGPADARFLGARLGFSFPRDVPKGAAAVAELILTGALNLARGELRVLDLGAGLGATSRGVARALGAAGQKGNLLVDLVDADETALAIAEEIVRTRPKEAGVSLAVRAITRAADSYERRTKPYDLILLGQILSEMDADLPAEERLERHVALVTRLVREDLTPRGSVVLIEPALRDRSRHLHAIRDALVEAGITVFAPCLHARRCPALVRENDWCHEDLEVELPPWLVPVARGAGLRFEGLSFSYLVLRRDDLTLAKALGAASEKGDGSIARAVSGPLVSKGKHELLLCPQTATLPGLLRGMRLDRNRSEANAPWDHVGRGDLIRLSPPPAEGATLRVGLDTVVEPLTLTTLPALAAAAAVAVPSAEPSGPTEPS
jgi:predicted O-methyltransferase YrrM